MKKTIYNSLFVYWNEPIMIGLLALLLDLRLKTLFNWDKETCKKAKKELMRQFGELIDLSLVQSSSSSGSLSQQQCHSRLHFSIFVQVATANPFSELECYLDPVCIPIANHNMNHFEWWAIQKVQFPNVAKAKDYFLIRIIKLLQNVHV
ncbi:hypothetical protein RclHR1_01090024 [Rhizophagus clarus]|uniref:HAT C-terminal dimerisation domain-containing protein n=1 Tax=Rhizophagus clarus TaxID=94130 RepID=A0A2Z6Q4D6_9GLOM|nr:hypothetical protein RclHR1_01090024 [Rhizophagus clarus]GET00804.1 hypothetical protein RCL_jg17230.t1 [Rhizophagus clarus]